MKRRLNSWRPGGFGLVLCALMLAGGRSEASDQSEVNALKPAQRYLKLEKWDSAETEFAGFLKKYPQSDHYAEAVLGEAQARFHLAREKYMKKDEDRQWNYQDVISLLATQQSHAADKADEFAYLTAEAWYASSNFTAAAGAYGGLAENFVQSDRRPEALFKEADAWRQLGDTPRVIGLLRDPAGAFQQVVKSNPTDEWVARGLYLLAELELAGTNYPAAADALAQALPQKQGSELEWSRQYLMCRVKLEGGPLEAALDASTNLLAAAGDSPVFTAESYQMRGDIYRGLERFPEAMAAYESILSNNLPMEQKRKAVLNIIELDLAQNQTDEAARRLDDFLQKNAGEKSSDFDLLALGELRLRQHFQAAGDTNFLRQAETNFVRLDTNSDFWGKAQLNLGWCLWEEGKFPESGVAFSNAVGRLPHGEDQAVALFKLGDVLYSQTNYARAIGAYSRIFDGYGAVPSVTNNLLEPALYQIVQAATAMTNLTAANDALKRILNWFPEGLLGQPAMLLLGETEDRAGSAAAARRIFTDFIARWPASPLRPEAELAVARTYERENDWTNAINRLYAWVVANTNSPALPQAEFQLACANYQAGNDSNAFSGFTNFIATYPANALAAQAWYWIGTYHFQREEYELAEVSFKGVFATNMAATAELQNQARMMAGKSAYGRRDYGVAIKYFEDLKEDTNDCPANVRLTAQYAWGDAEISSVSLTNLSPYQSAIAIFGDIVTNHPDDLLAPLAWGRMGDCYRQLGAANDTNQDWFALATAAYTNVISSSNADLATRCTAEYGVGQVLENMARSMPPGSGERTNLLQLAVDHYLNVVTGSNLRGDEEHRDPYWVWQTGMAAGRIESDDLKELDKALNLYQTLQDDLPPLQVYLGKKIAGILGQMAPLEHSGPVRDD